MIWMCVRVKVNFLYVRLLQHAAIRGVKNVRQNNQVARARQRQHWMAFTVVKNNVETKGVSCPLVLLRSLPNILLEPSRSNRNISQNTNIGLFQV